MFDDIRLPGDVEEEIIKYGTLVTYFPHTEGELAGLSGVVDACKRAAAAVFL